MEKTEAARMRGRRPGVTVTREAIIEEARLQFSDVGYRRTSMRSIAQSVGVDHRLILHYFGSKQRLFAATIELPFEPEVAFDQIFAAGSSGVGKRLAEFVLTVLEDPIGQRTATGVMRAAVSEPETSALVRDIMTERLLTLLAQRVSDDHAELRASLVAAQIAGFIVGRYVLRLDALAEATRDDLIRALAPVFDRYLTGDLSI